MTVQNHPRQVEDEGERAQNIGPTVELARIDTLHHDEATKVLGTYDGEKQWTDEEERRLRRKVDWSLMPIMCVTYALQYYDKNILSQASLFGIRKDLGLDQGNRFSWCASIFYLGYMVGAYPVMLIAQKYPIERVASAVVTLWGVCLISTSACTTYQGIYAQRFFLGVLEVGIGPMFMLVVGSWYKKNEQAMRMG
ncbi:hypothetical protein E4U54_002986 [Claviceps lovelessii]|nr:hypothetical protein E4U54_002986 [Claviceps lovelessii]